MQTGTWNGITFLVNVWHWWHQDLGTWSIASSLYRHLCHQSIALSSKCTKVCIKDWEWCRCKGHCGACPDAFIPFPFWQKFSCHGDKTKVLDTVGQLNEKMRKTARWQILCVRTMSISCSHIWLGFSIPVDRLLPLPVLFQLANENAFIQTNKILQTICGYVILLNDQWDLC
jgi:hypothetical protein